MARTLQLALVVSMLAACGRDPQGPATPADVALGPVGTAPVAPPPPPAPPQRNADAIAERMVAARSTALLHVESWRDHPLLPELASWMPLRGALERAHIDVAKDIDRVLLVSKNPRSWTGLTVFEHHIDRDRLMTFLHDGAASSKPVGEPLRAGDMVGARMNLPVSYRGHEETFSGDVWLPTPTLIVVVPPGTPGVEAFMASGGLPLPKKEEGASGWATEPGATFDNRHVAIPETLSRAEAWAFPRPGGALHIDVRARSTDHEQAMKDATRVTGSLAKATSVKLGPLTVQVFQTPVFQAEGDEIVTGLDVSRGQLEQLLALAGSHRPKF